MNTKYTEWGNNAAWGTQVRLMANDTLAEGNGILKRGTVLSKDAEGKLSRLILPSNVAAYDTGITPGDLDDAVQHIFARDKFILPGSVSLDVEGNNAANDATDERADGVIVRSDGRRVGTVLYNTGQIALQYPAAVGAGAVNLSYKRLNADGKSTPVGVLMNDEVDTSSADQPVSITVMGDVPRGGLIFPDTATVDYLAYVRSVLTALGIHETGLAHGT